jgi:hypothetical protein
MLAAFAAVALGAITAVPERAPPPPVVAPEPATELAQGADQRPKPPGEHDGVMGAGGAAAPGGAAPAAAPGTG